MTRATEQPTLGQMALEQMWRVTEQLGGDPTQVEVGETIVQPPPPGGGFTIDRPPWSEHYVPPPPAPTEEVSSPGIQVKRVPVETDWTAQQVRGDRA